VLVHSLPALVGVAFTVATARIDAMRPAGVLMLLDIVDKFGAAADPDFEGHLLIEQSHAQVGGRGRTSMGGGREEEGCEAWGVCARGRVSPRGRIAEVRSVENPARGSGALCPPPTPNTGKKQPQPASDPKTLQKNKKPLTLAPGVSGPPQVSSATHHSNGSPAQPASF
jgi:hypothetical protein